MSDTARDLALRIVTASLRDLFDDCEIILAGDDLRRTALAIEKAHSAGQDRIRLHLPAGDSRVLVGDVLRLLESAGLRPALEVLAREPPSAQ